MIQRCALGVILNRGRQVTKPTLSVLTADDSDYLERHVEELRAHCGDDNAVYTTFRVDSAFKADLELACAHLDVPFVGMAVRMVDALAAAIAASPRAKEDCVVALVTTAAGEDKPAETVTFLKLDARIEAARLRQAQQGGSLRLEVFKDLLPAPGDMQKGVSWPDPRHPASELIVHDTNFKTALYFQNAFGLRVSARSLETERTMARELVEQLGLRRAEQAVALVTGDGGRADAVVATIKDEYRDFETVAPQLGGDGRIAGVIRPNRLAAEKVAFEADGIELRVPLNRLNQVTSRIDGDRFVTTIRTSTPLVPPDPPENDIAEPTAVT